MMVCALQLDIPFLFELNIKIYSGNEVRQDIALLDHSKPYTVLMTQIILIRVSA